jgi:hypothetical protein
MLDRSQELAQKLGLDNIEFREGFIEKLPVKDGWADLVISNGVINLCPDKLGGLPRDQAGLEAGRPEDDRRHLHREAGPRVGDARHRPLDGVESRELCRAQGGRRLSPGPG